MLIPLSWLKDFVDIKLAFADLTGKLSEAGLTVEKWEEKDGDIIFDPEVTPNRPDWLSVYGIAREIAAVTNTKLKVKSQKSKIQVKIQKENPEIKIKPDLTLCPRYTAIVVKGAKVRPSPEWLQKRIKLIGLRPINNLVDITNYVMWEMGNPLHVFDLDKIRGRQMTMAQAKGDEPFRSLDGLDYKIPAGSIIIKDLGRVIDLCGIKGGENSAVDQNTKNILLHDPVYIPSLIRKTSQALGLRSDASSIYEKGANIGGTVEALLKAAELILDLAGGKITGPIIDIYVTEPIPWVVALSHQKLEAVLGITISNKDVLDIFSRLELKPKLIKDSYQVEIPVWRQDLKIAEDLIEEVVRLYGYNNFPKTLPQGPVPVSQVAYAYDIAFDQEAKSILNGAGFSEIYTYSLVAKNLLENLGLNPETTFKITNPISEDFMYLRPNLLGNMLEAVRLNSANFDDVALFELGKVYGGPSLEKKQEIYHLTGALLGEKFFEAKGVITHLLNSLRVPHGIIPPQGTDPTMWFHPGRVASVVDTSGKYLGFIAQMHPDVLTKFKIKSSVTAFSLNLDALKNHANREIKYRPVPKFPVIREDVTLQIPESVLVGDIMEAVRKSSPIISSVELIDVLNDQKTLRLEFSDPNKNLTSEEVGKLRKRILESLHKDLGVNSKD